jgi:ribosomal-protein-alanine N-acetyltransferase
VTGPRLDAGGGVVLRAPRAEDIPRIVKLADNRKVWMNLLDRFPHPYDEDDARAFLDLVVTMPGPLAHFAIAIDDGGGGGDEGDGGRDQLVGMAGIEGMSDVHRAGAHVGYWVGEPYWGRGIATAALKALTAYAFTTFSFERLEAEVFAWNAASARVLEKSGYRREARLRSSVLKAGQLIDGLLYARLRDDPVI